MRHLHIRRKDNVPLTQGRTLTAWTIARARLAASPDYEMRISIRTHDGDEYEVEMTAGDNDQNYG